MRPWAAAHLAALTLLPLLGTCAADVIMKLSDDNFEMETQASTGATTGSWLVTFGEEDCMRCKIMREELAGIDEELRQSYIIPAYADRSDSGMLWRRFNIDQVPTTLLFARGKMWAYRGPEGSLEITSFYETALSDMSGGREVPEEMNWLDRQLWKVGARQAADLVKEIALEYFGLTKHGEL